MARVYLDTNVFSNLKSKKDQKFFELDRLIDIYESQLMFCFSHAHIIDKSKDLTNYKFDDFAYMETLVGDNYIAYDPIKKHPSFYLATPLMVYNDSLEDKSNDLKGFFDPQIDDDDNVSDLKILLKGILSTVSVNFDHQSFQKLPESQQQLIAEIMPIDKDAVTASDIVHGLLYASEKISKDSMFYKELRRMVDEGLNNGTITLNNDSNFNEAFKNTALKMEFIDFVKNNIYTKQNGQIPFYDFYNSAYSMLDLFGISKDKITPKNTFENLQSDGIHSYFARYCDFFVTDDSSTIKKTSALYDLLEISTKVLSVNEFNILLPEILTDIIEDYNFFTNKLSYDIENGGREKVDEVEGKSIYRFERNHSYFGFFDSILEIKGPFDNELVIFKSESNILSEPGYYEQKKIIEKAVNIFGDDLFERRGFNYHECNKDNHSLAERTWKVGSLTCQLKVHSLINKYAFIITFPIL